MEYLELHTLTGALKMPILGLGTSKNHDPSAIAAALDSGYVLIDTAIGYQNELMIGEVLQKRFENGINTREEIFITSKLSGNYTNCKEHVRMGMEKSLHDLQVDYLDLYLIHSPWGKPFVDEPNKQSDNAAIDHLMVWKALEECVEEGMLKAIGVSNFNSQQVDRIVKNGKVPVAVNQVEMHAYHTQENLCHFCWDRGVKVTSYGSLGSGKGKITPMTDPIVIDIGKKHSKTPAQVLLRNLVHQKVAVIPKSSTPDRLKENLNIFDFKLDEEDMAAMKSLNRNQRTFDFPKFKDHPDYPFNIAY